MGYIGMQCAACNGREGSICGKNAIVLQEWPCLMQTPTLTLRGVQVFKGLLTTKSQLDMLQDLREVVRAAPLFTPLTPNGKKMSVRLTSAGKYGWFSDQTGYRYVPKHPSGCDWPAIPESVLAVWDAVSESQRRPECCLINFYGSDARMGLHQDNDEADLNEPVVSISLGDDALFRVGGLERQASTESLWLNSGDVVVLKGQGRMVYHGVDRIRTGSSGLLTKGGRINLTLRVVDQFPSNEQQPLT